MQEFNKIDRLTFKKKSIIDKSNIDQRLFNQVNFLNKEKLKTFYLNKNLGFPLLLNYNDDCFINKKNIFKINKLEFSKMIFGDSDFKYSQSKFYLRNGISFCENGELKRQYVEYYNYISKHNRSLIQFIQKLKKNNLKVGAFQTRNIPHYGHELIIKKLLTLVDIVIINPVIGPKKKGDFKSFALHKIFNYLSKAKYNNKIIYFPVIANMQYSGPREAIHHAILRENLGFDYFTIGRDHAGADGFYKNFEAINFIKKFIKTLKINIFAHKGTYFCKKCNMATFYENCKHKKFLTNISGSNFRNCIIKKEIYDYADKNMQYFIKKNIKNKIFY